MQARLGNRRHRLPLLTVAVGALLLVSLAALAQTPAGSRGVIRLRVRVKTGETTKGLSRKRFFLIPGTLEQNQGLVKAIETNPVMSRDCYYRSIGASEALIKWLQIGDCESVYCREIEAADVEAVPEFKRAVTAGGAELANRDLSRKWLTVNLAQNIRDGYYKSRQSELLKLITQAEAGSGGKVLSVMTDTKGTAYFTDLPIGSYVVSNLLPTENASSNLFWNCEIQVKAGDLSSEKPYLLSNVRDRNVKCVSIEKPLPACDAVPQRTSRWRE